MKILLDTNIVLDWWLERAPFDQDAQQVLSAVEAGELDGCLCATSVTTMFYLAEKQVGAARARQGIESLLQICEVAPVNRSVLTRALQSRMSDYEDAVVSAAAEEAGVEAIVTRDKHGFTRSPVRILTCREIISLLEEE